VFDFLSEIFQYLLHIDYYLSLLLLEYGFGFYFILFLIIFCETGLVLTPFLPGDSLLFAAGSLMALSSLNVHFLVALLLLAAILGDSVNYAIGHWLGANVFYDENVRFLNKKYLHRTQAFYMKHGGKAIIIARFIPIIRTFAPFVAGISAMPYRRFFAFNVIGACLWVGLLIYSGYWFGSTDIVRNHFSSVILSIIVLSLMPAVIEYCRSRYVRKEPSTLH
jgi:membrane-associated protein